MIDSNVKSLFYETFNLPVTDPITDDRVLKIMAAICWSYACTQNDFSLYEVRTKGELIDSVLEHAIDLSRNDDYIRVKIEEIFNISNED